MKRLFMSSTWEEADSRNSKLTLSNLIVGIIALMAVAHTLSLKERVTLVPPHLDRAVSIGWRSANEDYLKSFGMYAISLIMNVTPKNVTFISDVVAGFIDAPIYPDVRAKMLSLAQDPTFRDAAATVAYTPDLVDYERETNKVFVVGNLLTASAGNRQGAKPVVYEVVVEIRAGRPWITSLESYPGREPKTLKWLSEHKQQSGQPAAQGGAQAPQQLQQGMK